MYDAILIVSESWKVIYIGENHVGALVLTDTPTKNTYQMVQWFDSRHMTFNEAKAITSAMTLLGDSVMFDAFGQTVMFHPVAQPSTYRQG